MKLEISSACVNTSKKNQQINIIVRVWTKKRLASRNYSRTSCIQSSNSNKNAFWTQKRGRWVVSLSYTLFLAGLTRGFIFCTAGWRISPLCCWQWVYEDDSLAFLASRKIWRTYSLSFALQTTFSLPPEREMSCLANTPEGGWGWNNASCLVFGYGNRKVWKSRRHAAHRAYRVLAWNSPPWHKRVSKWRLSTGAYYSTVVAKSSESVSLLFSAQMKAITRPPPAKVAFTLSARSRKWLCRLERRT